jgi:hypothetical protein
MQKQVQNVIAVSFNAKQFVKDSTCDFSGPSKTAGITNASEREIVDAMQAFVEKHRYEVTEEIDEETGEITEIETDLFAVEVNAVLAERLTTTRTRTNTAAVKVASLEAEREALLAKIAALEAAQG